MHNNPTLPSQAGTQILLQKVKRKFKSGKGLKMTKYDFTESFAGALQDV